MKLLLASASPRRRDLLAAAGLEFAVLPVDIPEIPGADEGPIDLVRRLAAAKARAAAAAHPHHVVLGADTIVYCERILGKPRDAAEARAFIELLSGRTHQVYTGVCLTRRAPAREHTWHCTTAVTFKPLSAAQIDDYLAGARPLDKAGAYAIQDSESELIAGYCGLRSNVIGLPIEEVLDALPAFRLCDESARPPCR